MTVPRGVRLRAALCLIVLTPLALLACKKNEASVAPTNAAIDRQLEVINQHTPEDSTTLSLQSSPDAGKQAK